MLERFRKAYRLIAYLAMALLICAMLVTVVDVALRRSANLPILGTIDLVQLFVVAAAYMSIPFAFLVDGHVSVDLVTNWLPLRVQHAVRALGMLLAIGIMVLIAYYSWAQAEVKMEAGDVSQNISIPVIFYWAPLVAGCVLSVLSSVLVFVLLVMRVIVGGEATELSHESSGV